MKSGRFADRLTKIFGVEQVLDLLTQRGFNDEVLSKTGMLAHDVEGLREIFGQPGGKWPRLS